MSANIRLAAADDLPIIHQIIHDAYAHYVPRIGRKPAPMLTDYSEKITGGNLYVVELNGTVAGTLALYPKPEAMGLGDVAVAPHAQGSGLGRLLLDFAENKARSEGFDRMELFTNVAMTENVVIYEKRGYQETHRVVEHGLHRVYMTKALEPVPQGQ